MINPQLSICIPTYNFGAFIGATLDSITCQLPENAEIIILDGGSTDETAEVVHRFVADCPRIQYHRLEARGGIDRDMARSVDLASGEYCWLFSADDIMEPGSIARITRSLVSSSDIYLCKHTLCDLNMVILGETGVLALQTETTFELSIPAQRHTYFSLAETSEAFFSFMGSIIVKRSKWNAIPLNESFVGSCWAHVARMFELSRSGLAVTYIPETLLHRRGDNDSFADKGVVNRYRIAIEGYRRLVDSFYPGQSVEAFNVMRVIRGEFKFRTFLAAAMQCRSRPETESLTLLNRLVAIAYADTPFRGFLIRAGCRGFPSRLYPRMRQVYKKVLAPFRSGVT